MNPRDDVLDLFAQMTRLPAIKRVTQRGRDPESARFTFHFTDGRTVHVDSPNVLWSQTQLGRLFGITIGRVFPLIDRVDWHNAISALVTHGVDVEEAPDLTLADRLLDWLEQYLSGAFTNDRDGAAAQRQPFAADGEVWVAADHFSRWLRREYSEQIPANAIRTALVDLGFTPSRIQYNLQGNTKTRKRTTARYYRAPASAIEEADHAE